MSNWMFVGVVFAAIWIALFGYLAHLQRTMRRSRELFERATKAASR